MKQFIVTVKHDNGITKIRTAAEDKEAAAKLIMAAEGCPLNAIISIREAMYYRKTLNKPQDPADILLDKIIAKGKPIDPELIS